MQHTDFAICFAKQKVTTAQLTSVSVAHYIMQLVAIFFNSTSDNFENLGVLRPSMILHIYVCNYKIDLISNKFIIIVTTITFILQKPVERRSLDQYYGNGRCRWYRVPLLSINWIGSERTHSRRYALTQKESVFTWIKRSTLKELNVKHRALTFHLNCSSRPADAVSCC